MVDYFLLIDQKYNVVKVPARGNHDLLDYIFNEVRYVYETPDEYLTQHKTRGALYDTINRISMIQRTSQRRANNE